MPVKFTESDNEKIIFSADEAIRRLLDMAGMSNEGELLYDGYGSTFIVPTDRKFADIASIQRYVDSVLQLDWVQEKWPERSQLPIRVREKTKGSRLRATYEKLPDTGEILIPAHLEGGRKSWAMRESLVLHEIAHHFAKGIHGEEFVSTLVEFIARLIGPHVGLLYQIEVSKAREELASQRKE